MRPLPPVWEIFPHNPVFFLTTFLILETKSPIFSNSIHIIQASKRSDVKRRQKIIGIYNALQLLFSGPMGEPFLSAVRASAH